MKTFIFVGILLLQHCNTKQECYEHNDCKKDEFCVKYLYYEVPDDKVNQCKKVENKKCNSDDDCSDCKIKRAEKWRCSRGYCFEEDDYSTEKVQSNYKKCLPVDEENTSTEANLEGNSEAEPASQ